MKTPLEVAIEQYRRQHPRGKLPRPSRMLFPLVAERRYRRQLESLVKKALELFRSGVANKMLMNRQDADDSEIPLLDRVLQSYENDIDVLFGAGTARSIAGEMTRTVSNHNFEQMRKQFSRLTGMDVLQFTPEMVDKVAVAATQNAKLIVDVGDDIKQNVSQAVRDGFLKGQRWESIVDSVEDGLNGRVGVFKKAANRAALIARDQVATLNGTLTKDRNESLGISLYEWQTAGDARVRDSHKALNGEIFSWSGTVEANGRAYKEAPGGIFPGSEINCRCVAAPVFLED
jgi:SPP1 gp7 family putative phage head morphogenesis protein